MAGNAAIHAAALCREQIFSEVAKSWEIKPDDLVALDGMVSNPNNAEQHMTFAEAVVLTESNMGMVGSIGHYTPPKLGGKYKGRGAGPSPAYTFTCHIAEVTVNSDTGLVSVDKIVCAHDCGRALNPTIVEGQIEGSSYMGMGEATLEHHHYRTDRGKGLHRNPSLLEYKLPTTLDTPELEAIIVESVDPEGPFGAKESGEGPQHSATPAVVNAIFDAVQVRINHVPAEPEDIVRGLEKLARQQSKEGQAS